MTRTHCPKLTRWLPRLGAVNTANAVWELYHGKPADHRRTLPQ
jgi:hypothetical protein